MNTPWPDQRVRDAQQYIVAELRRPSLTIQPRNLERIRKALLQAICAQEADTNTLHYNALAAASHYSTTNPVRFRHISIEYEHIPSGWLIGVDAMHSYHNLCQIYWKRTFHIIPQSIFLDPATMSISLRSENYWEWRDSRRGPPWVEVVESRQTYDHNFKVKAAEYVTLTGRDTHCWLMKESGKSYARALGLVTDKADASVVDGVDDDEVIRDREALDALFFN